MEQNDFILLETIDREDLPCTSFRMAGLFQRHTLAYWAMNALYQKQLMEIIRDADPHPDNMDTAHFCIGKMDAFIRLNDSHRYYWEIVKAKVITTAEQADTLLQEAK